MSRRIPGRVCTRGPIRRAAVFAVFALLVISCTGQRSAVISPPPSTTEIGDHDLEGDQAREGEQEHDESVTSPEDERSGEVHVHEDGFVHTHGAGAPKEWIVTYAADGEFDPERLDILAGDTVTFANESEWGVWPASNIHPTHEIMPEFDPLEPVPPGESWSHTFTDNGYWRYHNHELASEVGLIVVTGGPAESLDIVMREFETLSFPPPPAEARGDLLMADMGELDTFVRKYGPVAAANLMWEHASARQINCHNAAHEAGRIAYEEFGPAVFSEPTHDCQTGALHGALEALFAERGTSRLHEDIASVCLADDNQWVRANCWHGVGHGLMAWASYELPDALDLCAALDDAYGPTSCYSGVFMENIIGGMSELTGHESEYVREDNLHFPCTVLDERFVVACYGYQPIHMLSVLNGDYKAVIRECDSLGEDSRHACWGVIGNSLGGGFLGQPATVVQNCGFITDDVGFLMCLAGAVRERFWQAEEASAAAAICNLVEDRAASNECWWQMIDRGQFLFGDHASRESFCSLLPEGQRQKYCREQLRL